MNIQIKSIIFTLFVFLTGTTTYAHDIEVQNADGVTIYYNYINDGTELEVTYRGDNYELYNNEYFGAVIIPENVTFMDKTRKVTSIGFAAFSYCSALSSVNIPNSVTSIGFGAFSGCSVLSSVNIPNSVTSIEELTFNDCSELLSITIPNSVISIGRKAFQDCSSLTSITIPNSVTSIGDGVFGGCSSLTSINIPNSVTSIGEFEFSLCTSLTYVDIPNSVISIGKGAFGNCISLTTVTIPNSVLSIGEMAFYNVDFSVVISKIENPFSIKGISSDKRTFSSMTFNNATLYVPKGTIDKYKATKGWCDFAHIEEETSSGISGVSAQTLSIQNLGSTIIVQGCDEGRQVVVYGLDGVQAGSTISHNGQAIISTSMQPGSIAIVKVGEKSVKVLMK